MDVELFAGYDTEIHGGLSKKSESESESESEGEVKEWDYGGEL